LEFQKKMRARGQEACRQAVSLVKLTIRPERRDHASIETKPILKESTS
jgi:hypothetical protein